MLLALGPRISGPLVELGSRGKSNLSLFSPPSSKSVNFGYVILSLILNEAHNSVFLCDPSFHVKVIALFFSS